jgi:hypothetical protein
MQCCNTLLNIHSEFLLNVTTGLILKQSRKFTYNVTLRGVRVTIAALEKRELLDIQSVRL